MSSFPSEPSESVVLRKVALRLIPFLVLLYVINIVDRANVGMAALQMVERGILDKETFALAGIFYVGYLTFEVPSNLILARVGARAWIGRILISWGLVSGATMFVSGEWSFYLLRILLGVAEAGFFPGIVLYLSQWFPARVRGRAMATFMTGGVMAQTVQPPISGAIMSVMDKVGGLEGWQWLFLLEGVPAVILGFVTFYYLTDRPEQANWLTLPERNWLIGELELERKLRADRHRHTLAAALVSPQVWLLIGIYFTLATGENSFGNYLPLLLKSRLHDLKLNEFQIGLLAAVPSLFAIVVMVAVSMHSDATGERHYYVAGAALVSGAGWALAALAPSPWLFLTGMIIALIGAKSMLGTFWTIPTSLLSGTAAAGGIALINSVANLGGFMGPAILGRMSARQGTYTGGMLVIAGVLGVGGVLTLCVRRGRKAEQ